MDGYLGKNRLSFLITARPTSDEGNRYEHTEEIFMVYVTLSYKISLRSRSEYFWDVYNIQNGRPCWLWWYLVAAVLNCLEIGNHFEKTALKDFEGIYSFLSNGCLELAKFPELFHGNKLDTSVRHARAYFCW